MSSIDILDRLDACSQARDWIGDRTPYQAWRQCERGDWLLWVAGKLDIDRKLLVLAACDCAETELKYVPDGEDRPRQAIETALAWCEGNATLAQVRYAYDAAYDAAYAAAYTAALAADAADAAYAEAREHHARLVRKRIPWRVVRDALAEYERSTR